MGDLVGMDAAREGLWEDVVMVEERTRREVGDVSTYMCSSLAAQNCALHQATHPMGARNFDSTSQPLG